MSGGEKGGGGCAAAAAVYYRNVGKKDVRSDTDRSNPEDSLYTTLPWFD